MTPAEKIWWTKFAAAIALSIVCILIQVYFALEGTTIFTFGAVIYLALSDVLARMNGVESQRALRIGIGVFLLTWVTSWVLLYTIYNPI